MIKFINIFLFSFLLSQSISAKKEQILFDLKFGFVKGGEAEIKITDTTFNGKPAIYYYLSGRTTGITEVMYGVNDIFDYESDIKNPRKGGLEGSLVAPDRRRMFWILRAKYELGDLGQ